MDILPEIKNRRSVRSFTDEDIKKEQLDRILEAGRLSPSAKNRQAWRFIVVQNPELREKIKRVSFGQEHVGQAKAIIAACTTNVQYRMPNGQLSYPIDLSFAVSFMMLQAEGEGLGSCVVTTYREQEVRQLLTVPYSMKVVMMLLLGVPEQKSQMQSRVGIDRIVSYEHW